MAEKYICKYCGRICKNLSGLHFHENSCKLNPNRVKRVGNRGHTKGHRAWNKGLTKETSDKVKQIVNTYHQHFLEGKINLYWKNKHLPKEMKEKISNSMKIAHNEGRAHNIGECRWNNEPSYPEKWFMKVIENEFNDKNYKREFPFYKFSLDFAWTEIKKCIEIDGEQHERFEEQKRRDEEKEKLLKENGWELLRIKWKDIFNSPKEYINKAKTFIDN